MYTLMILSPKLRVNAAPAASGMLCRFLQSNVKTACLQGCALTGAAGFSIMQPKFDWQRNDYGYMATIKRLTALFFLFVLVCTAGAAAADKQITVTFLGDCTLGSEEKVYAWDSGFAAAVKREGYAYFFSGVSSLLSQDDLTVANFEGVLKNTASGKTQRIFNFRGLPEYAQILALGSVEAVSLENNHADDYDVYGRRTTKAALTEAGVNWFDKDDAYIYEKDGIRIAFVSAWQQLMFYNRQYYRDTIASLKESGVQAVVVYVHFGQEYNPHHVEQQSNIAYLFIDAGADLVVGSHPHVLQGMEIYQNSTIFYSLGNFVFGGNVNVRALETVIPQVTFAFSDDGTYLSQQVRLYPANISGSTEGNTYQPVLVTGEAAEAVYQLIDQDSLQSPAPVLREQTDAYRDYEPVYAP